MSHVFVLIEHQVLVIQVVSQGPGILFSQMNNLPVLILKHTDRQGRTELDNRLFLWVRSPSRNLPSPLGHSRLCVRFGSSL